MRVINNYNVQTFDCDETLVMHDYHKYSQFDWIVIRDTELNVNVTCAINQNMVKLLKAAHAQGAFVIVWSRNGHKWAESIVYALELDSYVDQVMSKPRVYFDDRPVQEWMVDRIYIGPNEKFKQP